MNCTEFLAKLTDYFDGEIDPALLSEVKQHLSTCHHCEVVVSTTRHTIAIYREQQPYDFPEELSNRLCAAVMERCCALGQSPASAGEATASPQSAGAAANVE